MDTEFVESYLKKTSDEFPVYLFALLFIAMVLLSVLVMYVTRLKDYLNMVNRIPGAKHNPFQSIFVPLMPVVKNSNHVDMNVSFFQSLCAYTKLYGESGIWRFWAFFRPIVICCKPETAEEILSSNVIIDKSTEYNFMKPWLKTGLVTSGGTKWKSRRKLLTSAFHFRVLEVFLPVIEEQSLILVDKLKELNGKTVDVVPLVTLCTLDIICETAMGKCIGAQKNNDSPYLTGLHEVCETIFARIVRPWLWSNRIFYRCEMGKSFNKCVKAMSDFVQQVIRERKEEMLQEKSLQKLEEIANASEEGYFGAKKRQAFLDLLLFHHIRDNSLSLDDIEEEVDSFMFAGHDTTAVGISWMLYLLGLYPDIQQKAYDEVYSIFGDDVERNVTLEDVKELKYLECVLKETQRIYPSVPFVARKIREETLIAGYRVPKHSTVLVFSYMMHNNPKYYENPETFNPERFRPENCNGRHPFSYVPFSAGPRNCIGQKFAFMEEKVIVANILRNFVVKSHDHRDKIHFTMEMVCRSKYGLRLSFTPRLPGNNYKIRAEG